MNRHALPTLLCLALSLPAAGDIRLTDIPDIIVDPYQPDLTAPLDLDGDGITDIEIHADWGIWAWARPGCAIAKDDIYTVAKPAPFLSPIGPQLLWYENSLSMYYDRYAWYGVGFGARQFGKEEFLAVRIGPAESARYAWVCVRIGFFRADNQPMDAPACQVRFFAIESTPNTPIQAGLFPFLADCNGNGIDDRQDIAYNGALDANDNGIPDSCEPPAVYHVPEDFTTIQSAVSACRASGDEIIVGPGEYVENIHAGARSIYIHSSAGAERTIIRLPDDSEGIAPFEFDSPPAEPGALNSLLEGFTLTGHNYGLSGFVNPLSCRILNNTWGGVNLYNSRVESCLIANNGYGGNDAGVGRVGSTDFANCLLIANRGDHAIVWDFYWDYSTPRQSTFTNCTFIANDSAMVFGGSVPIRNSIMRGNSSTANAEFAQADHCSIDGPDPMFVRPPSPGPDNLWGTPDDDYGDLRLREGSPLLNTGANALVPQWVIYDAQGRPRVRSQIVDLGAYEGAACIGDLNLDYLIDDQDFVSFVAAYNELIVPEADSAADFNGDKQVDDADFVIFVTWYDRLLCP